MNNLSKENSEEEISNRARNRIIPEIKSKELENYEWNLETAFPNIEAPVLPLGNRVLVQIRNPRKKSKSGIIFGNETQETDMWNEMTAKVIKLGPVAFKNRDNLQVWPEGEWISEGEYVRVPKYGGDRIPVGDLGSDNFALFTIFNDVNIIAKISGDPLQIQTYNKQW